MPRYETMMNRTYTQEFEADNIHDAEAIGKHISTGGYGTWNVAEEEYVQTVELGIDERQGSLLAESGTPE